MTSMAMIDIGPDDTQPTGRSAPDPLLARPVAPISNIDSIERPGENTPRWVIPMFTAAGFAFIAALVLISS